MGKVTPKGKGHTRREFLEKAAQAGAVAAASSAFPPILMAGEGPGHASKSTTEVVKGEQTIRRSVYQILADYQKTSPIMHGRIGKFCNEHGDVLGLTEGQKKIFTALTLMRFDLAWERDPKIEFMVKGNYSNETVREVALGIGDIKQSAIDVEKGKPVDIGVPPGLDYRFTEASAREFLGTASSNRQMMDILLSGRYCIAKRISHMPFADKAVDVSESWDGFYLADRTQENGMIMFFDRETNEPMILNVWPEIAIELSEALNDTAPSRPFSFKSLDEGIFKDFSAGWEAAKLMGWTDEDILLLYNGVKTAEKEVSHSLCEDFSFDGFVVSFHGLVYIAALQEKDDKTFFLINPLGSSPALLRGNIRALALHEAAHELYYRGKGAGGTNLHVEGSEALERDYGGDGTKLEYEAAMEVVADTLGWQMAQDKKEYVEAIRVVNEQELKKNRVFLDSGASFKWDVYTDLAGIALMASRFGHSDLKSNVQEMVLDSVQGNRNSETYKRYEKFYNELDEKSQGIRLRR